MRHYFWLPVGLLFLLVACQSEPNFINHSPPNLTDTTITILPGCPDETSGQCISDSTRVAFGCDEVQAPPGSLGGLQPAYPIAACHLIPGQMTPETQAEIDEGLYFFYTGGLFGSYVRYVVFQDGEFRLVKSEEELRTIYAPIESPDEALSYAQAVTNLSAYYGLSYTPGYEYEVDTIEDTSVTPEADGYKLRLFHDAMFGCGPHWTSEVELHVSTDGTIEELGSKPLFRDPNADELCID